MKQIDKREIIRSKLADSHKSPLKIYKDLSVGNVSFLKFLYYEIVTSLLGPMPGGIGFFLRKKFYPRLFKSVGRRSEEHTSELQSRENLVCRLLLEKKKRRDEIRL